VKGIAAMLLSYIKRGNLIVFNVAFLDVDGVVITPENATLYLSYMTPEGVRASDTITMDENTDDWEAQWDSSVADRGRVHWSVRSDGPPSAKDGQFELEANLANPDPVTA
jgi:hypothetical protein